MPSDLQDLGKKLDELRGRDKAMANKEAENLRNAANMSVGMRAGAELVGAIMASGLIGYGLDRWFETKPVFLIIMLLLGVCTGFFNVWRTTQNIGTAVGFSELHRREKDAKTSPEFKTKNKD